MIAAKNFFSAFKNYSKLLKRYPILVSGLFSIFLTWYLLNYPVTSSKEYIISRAIGANLSSEYGVWGSLVDKFVILLRPHVNEKGLIFGLQCFIYLQVALIWGRVAHLHIQKSGMVSLVVLLSPFMLNYFTLATRDAIAYGLIIILIGFTWAWFRFIVVFFIILFVHKGLLPLFLVLFLIKILMDQKILPNIEYLSIPISIFGLIVIYNLMHYGDLWRYVPYNLYSNFFRYPVILESYEIEGYSASQNFLLDNMRGVIRWDMVFFGCVGQAMVVFFKKYLIKDLPVYYFSTAAFFVVVIFAAVPGATRLLYHAVGFSCIVLLGLLVQKVKSLFE